MQVSFRRNEICVHAGQREGVHESAPRHGVEAIGTAKFVVRICVAGRNVNAVAAAVREVERESAREAAPVIRYMFPGAQQRH